MEKVLNRQVVERSYKEKIFGHEMNGDVFCPLLPPIMFDAETEQDEATVFASA